MHKAVKALLPFCLLLSAAPAVQAISAPMPLSGFAGTEAFTTLKLSYAQSCQVYSRYVVRVTEFPAQSGQHLNVFKLADGDVPAKVCATPASQAAFNLRNHADNWLKGISGKHLFVYQSSVTVLRKLVVFNLETRRRLYQSLYHAEYDAEPILKDKRYLDFNKFMKIQQGPLTAADKQICPQAVKWLQASKPVGWLKGFRLDLQTVKAVPTGSTTCVALR